MPPIDENAFLAILLAIFASTGFWGVVLALVNHALSKKDDKDDTEEKQSSMLLGLGHDRIVFLGMQYVERGYVTKDEYEDLLTYLYHPYKELGGNGTAELVVSKVKELPIKNTPRFPESK